jgi:hypothetical protein
MPLVDVIWLLVESLIFLVPWLVVFRQAQKCRRGHYLARMVGSGLAAITAVVGGYVMYEGYMHVSSMRRLSFILLPIYIVPGMVVSYFVGYLITRIVQSWEKIWGK